VTDVLWHVMQLNFHRMGIEASEISARSLGVGGAMALLHGKINMKNIRTMSLWNSDAMMQYLHMQAQPVMGKYAALMIFIERDLIPKEDKGAYNHV
jgi:hypothetical protein